MTVDFISLGCSKNLVDSENLMGLFEATGFSVTHDSDNPQGEIVVAKRRASTPYWNRWLVRMRAR